MFNKIKAAFNAKVKTIPNGKVVEIDYTNYQGKRERRYIIPVRLYFSTNNQWHPEPQYILEAYDINKRANRDFAMSKVHAWNDQFVSK